MFCPNCGTKIEGAARFCPSCGTKLPEQETAFPGNAAHRNPNDGRQNENFRDQAYDGRSRERAGQERGPQTEQGSATAVGSMMITVLKVTAVVFAVPCVVQAIPKLFTLIGSVVTIFGAPLYGIFALLSSAPVLIGCVLMSLGLLLMALCLNPEGHNAEPLLLTAAAGGIIRVVLMLLSAIVSLIGGSVTRYRSGIGFIDAFWVLLYAVIVTAILYGLCFAAGLRPFVGFTQEDLVDRIQALPDFLTAEMENLAARFRKNGEAAQEQEREQTQSDGTVVKIVVMNEKRGLLKIVLLTIVTCGIYGLYEYHTIARDVNLACDGDGEHTAGFIKLFLLTLVTCGIYSLVWTYKFLNRVEGASRRYGFEVKTVGNMDLGICFIVLYFAGIFTSWLCGIGLVVMLYGYYLIFRNLNAMAVDYNRRMGNTDGTDEQA